MFIFPPVSIFYTVITNLLLHLHIYTYLYIAVEYALKLIVSEK